MSRGRRIVVVLLVAVASVAGAVGLWLAARGVPSPRALPDLPGLPDVPTSLLPEARPGDEAAFVAFLAETGARDTYTRFEAFLAGRGVADVAPAWHLWRQGTDWEAVGEPPFAVPPEAMWPAIPPTLAFVRDHVVPVVGPCEIVSAFRTDGYNAKAGGAKGSRHKHFEAVDLVPARDWQRDPLHEALFALWERHGRDARVGLGRYAGTRFHIDTWRHRKW